MALRLFLAASSVRGGGALLGVKKENDEPNDKCVVSNESRLRDFSVREVGTWLKSVNLDQTFGEAFVEYGIDGAMLADVQWEDLDEIGVGLKLQRRRLLRAIEEAKGSKSCEVATLLIRSKWTEEDEMRKSLPSHADLRRLFRTNELLVKACRMKYNRLPRRDASDRDPARCLFDALQWRHQHDVCAYLRSHAEHSRRIYAHLFEGLLSPYEDIFRPAHLFSLKRFEGAYRVVRAFYEEEEGGGVGNKYHASSRVLDTAYALATGRRVHNEEDDDDVSDVVRFERVVGVGLSGRSTFSGGGIVQLSHTPLRGDVRGRSSKIANLPLELVKMRGHGISAAMLGMTKKSLRFEVNSSGIVPLETMSALRYHSLTVSDLNEIDGDTSFASHVLTGKPWTTSNERVARKLVKEVAKKSLDRFETSAASDETLLAHMEEACSGEAARPPEVLLTCEDPCLLSKVIRSRIMTKRVLEEMVVVVGDEEGASTGGRGHNFEL